MTRNGTPPDDRDMDDVGDLYRQGATEMPPAHLDARVLHLARESVRRRRLAFSPFAPNWLVPASLTAVLALSASLVFLVELDETPRQPAPPATEADAGEPAAPARLDAVRGSRDEETKVRSGLLKREMEIRKDRRGGAARSTPRLQELEDPGRSRAAEPAMDAMRQLAPASPPAEQRVMPEAALEEATPRAAAKEKPRYPDAPAGAVLLDSPRPDSVSPAGGDTADRGSDDTDAWIARIEAMIEAGRTAEARAELARLLAEHPDMELPPALRDLLSASDPAGVRPGAPP